MVFNIWLLFSIISLWLLGLTAWVVYRELKFRRFLGKTKEQDLRVVLEDSLKNVALAQEQVRQINEALDQIKRKDLRHVQKVGLVRFNPFRDAGGNQSFALALLNEENAGIVLTGLHARETTRLYIKDVYRGGSKSELSKEEKQAIEQAIKS